MRIIDPQSAVLTNIEVLAYLTANPPRRPPNPPPNSQNWVPSPDLRDHNTVVKEIHNYVTRLSPHLVKYPRYLSPAQTQTQSQSITGGTTGTIAATTATLNSSSISTNPNPLTSHVATPQPPPPIPDTTPTPMDKALRTLISRLQPYGLTKGEVIMILNLGIGLAGAELGEQVRDHEGGDGVMDVDAGVEMSTVDGEVNGDTSHLTEEEVHEEEGAAGVDQGDQDDIDITGGGDDDEEGGAKDYGALALLDTVIEEREERLSNEDGKAVLAIIRETLSRR